MKMNSTQSSWRESKANLRTIYVCNARKSANDERQSVPTLTYCDFYLIPSEYNTYTELQKFTL